MPPKKYGIVVRREHGDAFETLRRAFCAEAVRWNERQGDRRLATVVIQVDRRRRDRRGPPRPPWVSAGYIVTVTKGP